MKTICVVFLFLSFSAFASDSVYVLFVYGSKPKVNTESNWFGGIHGGHVSVSYNQAFISFVPHNGVRVFPRRTVNSAFVMETDGDFIFDTARSRYLLLAFEIDSNQRLTLDSICRSRLDSAEYEYAFFGMRCASAAYDLLSAAEILPKMKRRHMVFKFFYPKLLRKRLIKKAKKENARIFYRPGRKSRKWERD
ncbi:MAG TPA: hypothetical protein VGF79_03990 [Bacteroidia bacterium]